MISYVCHKYDMIVHISTLHRHPGIIRIPVCTFIGSLVIGIITNYINSIIIVPGNIVTCIITCKFVRCNLPRLMHEQPIADL